MLGLPATATAGNVLVHRFAILATEASCKLAILAKQLFGLVRRQREDAIPNGIDEDVNALLIHGVAVTIVIPLLVVGNISNEPESIQGDFPRYDERVTT